MAEPDADAPRYDDLADGYARHWGPVIRPAAEALLDRLAAESAADAAILDVGTGTGALAIAALRRWPRSRLTGLDPSSAMLELATAEAVRSLPPAVHRRFTTVAGVADRLPFADATFDVVLSSFVLQLVPSRAGALREMSRVLRPGGRLAWVTWLVGGERFGADQVVDEVLDEFGFDPPERDDRSGDLASVAAAATATRRAGFGAVHAAAATLEHTWTPEGYAAFIAEFDEQSTFAELESDERRRAEERLLERLRGLSSADLTMRLPIVYVTGEAPGVRRLPGARG
ncbi:MAG TPA: class I SAM-dependent methyltransferase [Candidatus Acidoferrales bacterium]|jgi:SAM-dependent methyltransferase|nr:class I SAM-dependent methyltransferase [Candidatus Acidoferrales bacterium]